MILMGDEVRRTQRGNNNAYCHDHELTWFDWDLPKKYASLFRFVKILLAYRLQRDSSKEEFSMKLKQLIEQATVTWHGVELNNPDWSENSHSIAFTIQALSGTFSMHYIVNAYTDVLEFALPKTESAVTNWRRWIDTSLASPDDICIMAEAPALSGTTYKLNAHAIAILVKQT
jgi:glycogen operon protein